MKVGFLGTGLMGKPLAQRLLSAKIPVIAYNRTASKLEELKAEGVEVADSPESAIASADCIILMLTNVCAWYGLFCGYDICNLSTNIAKLCFQPSSK